MKKRGKERKREKTRKRESKEICFTGVFSYNYTQNFKLFFIFKSYASRGLFDKFIVSVLSTLSKSWVLII